MFISALLLLHKTNFLCLDHFKSLTGEILIRTVVGGPTVSKWITWPWTALFSIFPVHSNHCTAVFSFPCNSVVIQQIHLLSHPADALQNSIQRACPAISLFSYLLTCWFIDEDKILCVVGLPGPAYDWMVCEVAALSAQEAAGESEPLFSRMSLDYKCSSLGAFRKTECDCPTQDACASSFFSLQIIFITSSIPLKESPSSNKSKGVCLAWARQLVRRQSATETGTEVLCRKLIAFSGKSVLALLRGIPYCVRWVDVGNGASVKYWNLPSIFSG